METPVTVKTMTPAELSALRKIKYYLLDMDGTIYLDTTLIDGTLDFLGILAKQGKKPYYITNNSSKAISQYTEKLAKMGIQAAEEDFCTSVHATVHYLNNNHPGAKLYVIGTDPLKKTFKDSGFAIVETYEKDPDKRPDYVVLAFDTSVTYEKLNVANMYLQDGVGYIATHPDDVCPVDGIHSMPDAGAFIKLFECSARRLPSFIAGKPAPTMIKLLQEKLGCADDEIAVVGDRLYTDILSAVNAGVVSICVLSGEATLDDVRKSPFKPDYIFGSVKDIYEALL